MYNTESFILPQAIELNKTIKQKLSLEPDLILHQINEILKKRATSGEFWSAQVLILE